MRISDWSSDVCSSDLWPPKRPARAAPRTTAGLGGETMKSRTCYSLMTAGMLALCGCTSAAGPGTATEAPLLQAQATFGPVASGEANDADRKSTRQLASLMRTTYVAFCFKKKK